MPFFLKREIQCFGLQLTAFFSNYHALLKNIIRVIEGLSRVRVTGGKITVNAQVTQARNMSIGEHRHCCVTFKI